MKFFKLNIFISAVIFIVISVLCTGVGMGVPILNILFGFLIGWYAAVRAINLYSGNIFIKKRILFYNLFCTGFTFIMMVAVWGRTSLLLLEKSADYENFGHPMILYDPKISFIGWLVLMIVISPFLQLLTSIFSSYLTLILYKKKIL